jgi:hypothetical protein
MGRCRYGRELKKNAAEFIGNEVLDFSYTLRRTKIQMEDATLVKHLY